MEKRLHRIKNNETMLGGVSLGLGEHFNLDPVLFRLLFVGLFFTPFPALFIYLILWLFLPVKNSFSFAGTTEYSNIESSNFQKTNLINMSNQSKNGSLIGGAVLIILGLIFSIENLTDFDIWDYIWKLWPLGLVGLGIWMIVKDRDNGNNYRGYNSNDSDSI
ncbi:MAG: PspC domain-containing protein [Spirosomataceae bacterium]